jgi:hypothetical protein
MFKSASQAGQDLFVYRVLGNKRGGTYLEIGAGDCIAEFNGNNCGSNTLRLSDMEWNGIGIDLNEKYKWGWDNIRGHKYIIDDATTIDWNKVIMENSILQQTVDYLSFDLDDSTSQGIQHFPFDKIRFRVLTIEHDSYRVGNNVKILIRQILLKHGYLLLCSDVSVQITDCSPWIYEDWWVDPTQVNMNLANKFRANNTLGIEIAHRNLSDDISIPVSVGEALDKLTILQLKNEYIKDPIKLVEIKHEFDIIYSLIQSYTILYENLYKQLYDINKLIWNYSDDIRKLDKKSPQYVDQLIWIMEKNDERYNIKAQINKLSNSRIKEQKSYKDTINYICGGKLGDLVHSIYVIMIYYMNTGKKGNLYITDNFQKHHGKFTTNIQKTYSELYNIIISQEYINTFNILDVSNIPSNFIDISCWYNSPLLYKTNWCNLVSSSCNVKEIPKKWLTLSNINILNQIVIHRKNIPYTNFPWENILEKNKCIFITCNIDEYNSFLYKNLVSLYLCTSLEELVQLINDSKFFIGNQSSPLAFACSLHKPCLAELLDSSDSEHYKDETKNNPNFFWIWKNISTIDGINKFINL